MRPFDLVPMRVHGIDREPVTKRPFPLQWATFNTAQWNMISIGALIRIILPLVHLNTALINHIFPELLLTPEVHRHLKRPYHTYHITSGMNASINKIRLIVPPFDLCVKSYWLCLNIKYLKKTYHVCKMLKWLWMRYNSDGVLFQKLYRNYYLKYEYSLVI